jgi:hypothetical protein
MESSGAGFGAVGVQSDFFPGESLKVEGPHVVHISHTLTAKDDEVRIEKLGSMVGSFPWGLLVLLG